jgi:hypothetical protein
MRCGASWLTSRMAGVDNAFGQHVEHPSGAWMGRLTPPQDKLRARTGTPRVRRHCRCKDTRRSGETACTGSPRPVPPRIRGLRRRGPRCRMTPACKRAGRCRRALRPVFVARIHHWSTCWRRRDTPSRRTGTSPPAPAWGDTNARRWARGGPRSTGDRGTGGHNRRRLHPRGCTHPDRNGRTTAPRTRSGRHTDACGCTRRPRAGGLGTRRTRCHTRSRSCSRGCCRKLRRRRFPRRSTIRRRRTEAHSMHSARSW